MELPQDPFMLLSMVNMKLRDSYSNPEDLCKSEGIDRSSLEKKLAEAGFEYVAASNQFK